MRRIGTLGLTTALLAGSLLGGATYAGSATAASPGHHGHRGHDHGHPGHDHGGALSWSETVIDAAQSFRGLDAVDRRTAWVTGGSATAGVPGRVFRTTDGGKAWKDVSPPARRAFSSVTSRHATRRTP